LSSISIDFIWRLATLSFYGLIQDDCYIFGLKPVGYTESYQRMGAPTLLNEQVVEDDVLGPCTYFF
jgi:hypothetical protein